MITLVSAPRSLTFRMRLQLGLMIALTALALGVGFWLYWPPSPGDPPHMRWLLIAAVVAVVLLPFTYGWGRSTLRIEPDRLTMSSNLPRLLKSHRTDWTVHREEIRSLTLQRLREHIFTVCLDAQTGIKSLGMLPWYRIDRSVESQELPFLVLRASEMLERARASALVTALVESGFEVTFPAPEASVDGFARSTAGRAVAAVAIFATLLAVGEALLHPHYAYLGWSQWFAIVGGGALATALAFRVLKNAPGVNAFQQGGGALILGVCVGLLVWCGGPRFNVATAIVNAEWIYEYESAGVFVPLEPGPPPLDLGAARDVAESLGWRQGDKLEVTVIRGAVGVWQYDRRPTHRRIENGPAD